MCLAGVLYSLLPDVPAKPLLAACTGGVRWCDAADALSHQRDALFLSPNRIFHLVCAVYPIKELVRHLLFGHVLYEAG